VVQLVDGYSGLPAVGASPQFALDLQRCRPLAKPQAFYAFVGLTSGSHKLAITEKAFFAQEIALQVPMAKPLAEGIVPCTLLPNPLYPYPLGITLVRGRVMGPAAAAKSPVPLSGVQVSAGYTTSRGRALTAETWTFDRGAYDGRYAMALRGKLASPTEVTLDFRAPSGARQQKKVSIEPGVTSIVDAELA